MKLLRLLNAAEGLSYLLLVGVAMPLKYLAADASAVHWLGRVHGTLFVLFGLALTRHAIEQHWGGRRIGAAFLLSLLPFGALVLDRSLRREATL